MQISTPVASAEYTAKFVPSPSHVAPRGRGLPGRILEPSHCSVIVWLSPFAQEGTGCVRMPRELCLLVVPGSLSEVIHQLDLDQLERITGMRVMLLHGLRCFSGGFGIDFLGEFLAVDDVTNFVLHLSILFMCAHKWGVSGRPALLPWEALRILSAPGDRLHLGLCSMQPICRIPEIFD